MIGGGSRRLRSRRASGTRAVLPAPRGGPPGFRLRGAVRRTLSRRGSGGDALRSESVAQECRFQGPYPGSAKVDAGPPWRRDGDPLPSPGGGAQGGGGLQRGWGTVGRVFSVRPLGRPSTPTAAWLGRRLTRRRPLHLPSIRWPARRFRGGASFVFAIFQARTGGHETTQVRLRLPPPPLRRSIVR